VLRTRIRRWLRAGMIVAAIFVAWFGLGVLTYNDDSSIEVILGGAAGFHWAIIYLTPQGPYEECGHETENSHRTSQARRCCADLAMSVLSGGDADLDPVRRTTGFDDH
jgi:hypothetical protein